MHLPPLAERLRLDLCLRQRCVDEPVAVLIELRLDLPSLVRAGSDLADGGPELDGARAALFALFAAARH